MRPCGDLQVLHGQQTATIERDAEGDDGRPSVPERRQGGRGRHPGTAYQALGCARLRRVPLRLRTCCMTAR